MERRWLDERMLSTHTKLIDSSPSVELTTAAQPVIALCCCSPSAHRLSADDRVERRRLLQRGLDERLRRDHLHRLLGVVVVVVVRRRLDEGDVDADGRVHRMRRRHRRRRYGEAIRGGGGGWLVVLVLWRLW